MAAISELEKQLRESVGEVKIPFETVVLSTIVERATLKSARALDPSNWPEAARHFYSVYLDRELDTSTRIEGLTGAAQMLINHNEIDRAIGMLEGGRVLLEDLSGDDKLIGESDVDINLKEAEELLREDMQLYPDAKGVQAFGNLWLARIELLKRDLKNAREKAEAALQTLPDVGGHYNVIMGRIDLEEGKFASAMLRFSEADRIFRKVGYPKGISDSLYLQAICEFYQGDQEKTKSLYKEALEINPFLPKRGFV